MPQGVLPFQYQQEKVSTGMTALGGLPAYLDLVQVAGLKASIDRHVSLRDGTQGWSDSQMITSLVLLNLAGGDSVDDPSAALSEESESDTFNVSVSDWAGSADTGAR